MLCTVAITKEDDTYIARDIRTNVTDEGDTMEEAMANLKEALELYYENNEDYGDAFDAPVYTATLEVYT